MNDHRSHDSRSPDDRTMTDRTLTTLRSLDPADAGPDAARSSRAQGDLARILASAPDSTAPGRPVSGPLPRPARRRRAARWAVLATATAALAAGLVVTPDLLSGDAAYATWTARPHALPPGEAAEAGAACREQMSDGPSGGPGIPTRQDVLASRAILAEQRGAWTLVLLSGKDGLQAMCVTDSSKPFFSSMFGSMGRMDKDLTPGPRDVAVTDIGSGSADAGWLSLVSGWAGDDVTGITLHSRLKGDVQATVTEGRFAAWWPGREWGDDETPDAAVTLTFRDGTTQETSMKMLQPRDASG